MKTINCVFFLLFAGAALADNTIMVDQVGSNNTFNIDQIGNGHQTAVNLGATSDVDSTYIAIQQKDAGAKTTAIEIRSGINNSVTVLQEGTGNHVASVQNLNGSGNSVTVNQTGTGKHEFNVVGGTGSTTTATAITGNQSGPVGSDKWFAVNLNGSVGATVNVVQDGAAVDQASMNIQCLAGTCGTFSYIKH